MVDPYARRANDAAGTKEQYYYSDYYAAWAPPTISTPGGAAAHVAHQRREQEQQMKQVRAQAGEWCSQDRLVELFIDFHVLVPSSVPSLHGRKSACTWLVLLNCVSFGRWHCRCDWRCIHCDAVFCISAFEFVSLLNIDSTFLDLQ